MKRKILRTLSLAIMMAMLLTSLPVPAGAENDGQISITVGNSTSKAVLSGIVFDAYLLARGDYGVWTTTDEFSSIKITARDDGSAWIDQSMRQIQSRIRRNGLKPYKSATTNASGKALFTDLEHGIYYVQASKIPDYRLTISAMLLSTPDRENKLNIIANAKYTESETPPGGGGGGGGGGEETPPTTPTGYWPPVKKLIVPTRRGERLTLIDEYETALGLGNIQIHVGVCYE